MGYWHWGSGLGRLQKRINPVVLTFDNQYVEGDGFDPSLPSRENFLVTKSAFTDFSVGLIWKGNWGLSDNMCSTLGLSVAHPHMPDQGFFDEMSNLPMKTLIHGKLDFKLDNKLILSPHILLQKQGVHQEAVGGMIISGSFAKQSDFNVGMAYRRQDAVILQMGVELGNKSIWASYDANSSSLRKATSRQGAWELGLYLKFDYQKKKQPIDTDKDGLGDLEDKCPNVPGLEEFEGCPTAEYREKKDADKDGILDDEDRCPLEKGLACFQGCNDRDLDGILDLDDSCPEIFGHIDNQGCPVKDRDIDKDGVQDSEDHCVYLKGLPEYNGCPDSDNDGISDIDDDCPYVRGGKDNLGCPAIGGLDMSGGLTMSVEFETNQAMIRPAYHVFLNQFSKNMASRPRALFVISGHTDSEGSADHNYELSLRRAQAVKDYLVRLGIPHDKMRVIPYGESLPKTNNETEEGKAKNRRVGITVIERN